MNQLQHFINAHNNYYAQALAEIKRGRKETDWMWYIWPQIGLEHIIGKSGSAENEKYAIKSLKEAEEYLESSALCNDGKTLFNHLEEITQTLRSNISNVNHYQELKNILGNVDNKKLISSLTLFTDVANRLAHDKRTHRYNSFLTDAEYILQGVKKCQGTISWLKKEFLFAQRANPKKRINDADMYDQIFNLRIQHPEMTSEEFKQECYKQFPKFNKGNIDQFVENIREYSNVKKVQKAPPPPIHTIQKQVTAQPHDNDKIASPYYTDLHIQILRDALLRSKNLYLDKTGEIISRSGSLKTKTYLLPEVTANYTDMGDDDTLDNLPQNIRNIIYSSDQVDIQILFPVRKGTFHWNVGQIRIYKNLKKAEFLCHDPYGRGSAETELVDKVEEAFYDHPYQLQMIRESPIKGIQGTKDGDGLYCGGYSTHLIDRLIDDPDIYKNANVWQGMKRNNELQRQMDLDLVRKHNGGKYDEFRDHIPMSSEEAHATKKSHNYLDQTKILSDIKKLRQDQKEYFFSCIKEGLSDDDREFMDQLRILRDKLNKKQINILNPIFKTDKKDEIAFEIDSIRDVLIHIQSMSEQIMQESIKTTYKPSAPPPPTHTIKRETTSQRKPVSQTQKVTQKPISPPKKITQPKPKTQPKPTPNPTQKKQQPDALSPESAIKHEDLIQPDRQVQKQQIIKPPKQNDRKKAEKTHDSLVENEHPIEEDNNVKLQAPSLNPPPSLNPTMDQERADVEYNNSKNNKKTNMALALMISLLICIAVISAFTLEDTMSLLVPALCIVGVTASLSFAVFTNYSFNKEEINNNEKQNIPLQTKKHDSPENKWQNYLNNQITNTNPLLIQ